MHKKGFLFFVFFFGNLHLSFALNNTNIFEENDKPITVTVEKKFTYPSGQSYHSQFLNISNNQRRKLGFLQIDPYGTIVPPVVEIYPEPSMIAPETQEEPPFLYGEIKWYFENTKFRYSAIIPRVADAPQPKDPPVVFLNYDETITNGEIGPYYTDVSSKAVKLYPKAKHFDIGSSHANGSQKYPMRTGVRFSNHSATEPLTLEVPWPPSSYKGEKLLNPTNGNSITFRQTPAPPRLVIIVPPGKTLDVPVVQAKIHIGPNIRDGSCPAIFKFPVSVVEGDPDQIEVIDIACHPGTSVENPSPHAGGETYHHQGVFREQVQVGPPVVLNPGVVSSFAIRGKQIQHDAHYETRHRFFISFPPDKEPQNLIFLGTGGYAYPEINGKRRGSVQLIPRRDSNGNLVYKEFQEGENKVRYVELAKLKSLTISFSEAKKWLIPVECEDGSIAYALDITFKPGDNGNLGVMAQY